MNGTNRNTARKKTRLPDRHSPVLDPGFIPNKSKFEVYGEEMIEKEVKQSGNSGRVYLPPEWIGKNVKIIQIERRRCEET
jgi:putative transposon-encoded protein